MTSGDLPVWFISMTQQLESCMESTKNTKKYLLSKWINDSY